VVYGSAHEEDKMDFLIELSSFCSKNREPIMIGGNFNIIRYSNERNKPRGNHRHSDSFNSLIHFYELREIIMSGGLYTWSNNQENPTLKKLDRILISKEWEDNFPNALVKKLPREVSDHNPLVMYTTTHKPHSSYSIQI
jgi:exonuclease III